MDWNEAKAQCLVKWERISDQVGRANSAQLLREVTEPCALCHKADDRQAAAQDAGGPRAKLKCLFCLAYTDYGGCLDRIDDLTSAVVSEEWDTVRDRVEDMIAWINKMELPAEGAEART
ncbi:MAG: hypothetical protein HY318_07100 [Armatimonadetes bacterium]|nr:hypothetical protein [Armatimonadota bacterium]